MQSLPFNGNSGQLVPAPGMLTELTTVDLRVMTDQHAPPERRYRLLEVDLDVFLRVFIPGPPNVWFRCYDGLPEGARVAGVQWDSVTRQLRLLVEHEGFEPVRDGHTIPPIGISFVSWTQASPGPGPED